MAALAHEHRVEACVELRDPLRVGLGQDTGAHHDEVEEEVVVDEVEEVREVGVADEVREGPFLRTSCELSAAPNRGSEGALSR